MAKYRKEIFVDAFRWSGDKCWGEYPDWFSKRLLQFKKEPFSEGSINIIDNSVFVIYHDDKINEYTSITEGDDGDCVLYDLRSKEISVVSLAVFKLEYTKMYG
jgi:hypothetical protein